MNWTVLMWHFGADALTGYSGKRSLKLEVSTRYACQSILQENKRQEIKNKAGETGVSEDITC